MLTCPDVTITALSHFDAELGAPFYATAGAAGADLRASFPEDQREAGMTIAPGQRAVAPTGLAFAIPEGFEAQIRPRSGLALRQGLTVANAPGTVDSDYRGEVMAILINHGDEPVHIAHGDRIAQMIIAPVVQAKFTFGELNETKRGAGGFGSTGVKGGG